MRLIVLVPREKAYPRYIEAIEITEENITIRKLPYSYDLNWLKRNWDDS